MRFLYQILSSSFCVWRCRQGVMADITEDSSYEEIKKILKKQRNSKWGAAGCFLLEEIDSSYLNKQAYIEYIIDVHSPKKEMSLDEWFEFVEKHETKE